MVVRPRAPSRRATVAPVVDQHSDGADGQNRRARETHAPTQSTLEMIQSIQRNAPSAPLFEQTTSS
jgi:hypothetical protein